LNSIEVSFLLFRSFRLVALLFAAKRRPISLCSVRWLLEVFLVELRSLWVFVQVAGFHLNWITYCPLLAPLPLWTPTEVSAKKKGELSSFSQFRQELIDLKRDGARICLWKDVKRWSIEGFLSPSLFDIVSSLLGDWIKT
jgi:hypothetical protein